MSDLPDRPVAALYTAADLVAALRSTDEERNKLHEKELADLRRKLAASERIRENADFHLGQEMARRQLAEKETARLRADRAAVLREAIDVAREEGHRLEAEQGIEAARGARSVAYLLRKLLVKADAPVDWAVVAYRSPGARTLYCVTCARRETGWQPVTADMLPDVGTVCDFCGGRVLAAASRTLGDVVARYMPATETQQQS